MEQGRRGWMVAGLVPALAAVVGLGLTACGAAAGASSSSGKVVAVGAENEYANVISQIGGVHVSVSAIMSNPNTDPHTFEASPSVATEVGAAQLVVQNGVGYDTFMNKIEAADPRPGRKVIDVQKRLGLPDSTPNPHLWYKPTTMPRLASAVERGLASLQPANAGYFKARLDRFDAALTPWKQAMAKLKSTYPAAPVATTEPVADYMIQAAGLDNLTPWTLQADVMNGVDPTPQNVSVEEGLFTQHKVKVFIYNEQVVDSLTETFLGLANKNNIPVIGVYETMPPDKNYQSWMLAEVQALQRALADHQSTQHF